MNWLNERMDNASCMVAHIAFVWWGKLYLNNSHVIVSFENDASFALNSALQNGFSQVYFVWWNQSIDWYGVSVPEDYFKVQDFGRISVYEFNV